MFHTWVPTFLQTTSCQMHPRLTVVHFRVCSQQMMCSRTGYIWHDVVSISVGTHMAANCITPDLCEKMLRQFLRWLWTSFSSHKTKKFHGSPTSQHSKWLGVFSATTRMWRTANQLLRTRLTFSKSLMVSAAVSKPGCSLLRSGVCGSYYHDKLLL